MNPEEKEYREENRYFVTVVERVLRRDPLLLPYFEDGIFKLADNPEEEFMWFDPSVSPELRAFIKERVEIVLGEKPGEEDEDAVWLWGEREKIKKQLENDGELFPYIFTGVLIIRNAVDGFKIDIATDLCDADAAKINDRLREILILNFGLTPELSDQKRDDPEFGVAS